MIRLTDIITWWVGLNLSLNPMSRVPGWKQAQEAENRARRRNDTRGIGHARKGKRAALHANMAGRA